jgi:hypothetical protein
MSPDENPYQSPVSAPYARRTGRDARGSPVVRLGVVGFHVFLLMAFSPFCCPCGFGPIGFLIQPYMMLLGLPSILLPVALPQLHESNPPLTMSLYVINVVLLSYLLGHWVDLYLRGRRSL